MSVIQNRLHRRHLKCATFFGFTAIILTVLALALAVMGPRGYEFTPLSAKPWLCMASLTSLFLGHFGILSAIDHLSRPISIIIFTTLTVLINSILGATFGLVIDSISALELRINKSNHAA